MNKIPHNVVEIRLGHAMHDEHLEIPLHEFVKAVEKEPRLGTVTEFICDVPNYELMPLEIPTDSLLGRPICDGVRLPETAKMEFILRPELGSKPYNFILSDTEQDTGYFVDPLCRDLRVFDEIDDLNEVITFGIAYLRYLLHDLFSESDDLCTPEKHYS